jgi:two-component system, NarL family, nitrate/nitrite response regulator NarL
VLSKPNVQSRPEVGPAFRVLIVDRDSMSSDLLANALAREKKTCHASAVQSVDLLRILATNHIDLVIIGADVHLQTGNGFDLAHTVGRAHPNVLIVMLLNQSTHDSVINAFRSGARGVFSREQPMANFLECVDHVRKGFIWAGGQEAKFLLEAFRSIPAPNPDTSSNGPALTARELQVVQYAAKAKTNKAIACELGLSEHTVKNYLFRAFEKLGVSSRVELLFYLTMRGHTFGATQAEIPESDQATQ